LNLSSNAAGSALAENLEKQRWLEKRLLSQMPDDLSRN